jgi:hypothetical protein
MGLLSSIKKGLKKIGSWVSKAFKTITKPIRKALENKWVRRALMAVTFFTGAGAVLAAFQSGGLSAGLAAVGKHLLNIGVKIIRTPFDIVAGGLKLAGGALSGVGANSLGSFATNLGKGLSTRVDSIANSAANIFAKTPTAVPTPTGQSAATPVESVSPSATSTLKTIDSARTPVPEGSSPIATPQVTNDRPGYLSRALTWAQENPELTKIGVDAIAAMTTPDEYTRSDEIRDTRKAWQNAGNAQSADPFGGGGGLLSALRRRNEELYAQGQTRSAALVPGGM